MFVTYTTAHSKAGSLTHWVRPGFEPETSWFLVRFVNQWAMTGTPCFSFFLNVAVVTAKYLGEYSKILTWKPKIFTISSLADNHRYFCEFFPSSFLCVCRNICDYNVFKIFFNNFFLFSHCTERGVRLSLHVYITITFFPPPFFLLQQKKWWGKNCNCNVYM